MPFYYVNGDTRYDLEDLPIDSWVKVQQATGKQWHQILSYNKATDALEVIGNAEVAKAVLTECASVTGTELPALTVRSMLELLRFEAGESRPTDFEDGMPDPKATATDPETT